MGILIGTPATECKRRTRGEEDYIVVKDEIKKIRNANNNPKKQCPKRHRVFLPKPACDKKDFITRQGTNLPDEDVQKIRKIIKVNNGKFEKIIFEDGSVTIAPKGHLMGGAEDNGTRKQGLNTVFVPKSESKENGGFILNTNHNSM